MEAAMSERRRLANLAADAVLTAGCAVCAVESLCRGLLGGSVLRLLLGLGWLACAAVWMAHTGRFAEKSRGSPLER